MPSRCIVIGVGERLSPTSGICSVISSIRRNGLTESGSFSSSSRLSSRAVLIFSTMLSKIVNSDSRWNPLARRPIPVSYTHLRAHETDSYLVCRLLLEKKKKKQNTYKIKKL